MSCFKHRKKREYVKSHCKGSCGFTHRVCDMYGNGKGLYCFACWNTLTEAERDALVVHTYSLNGKDVTKEEFDAAMKREYI